MTGLLLRLLLIIVALWLLRRFLGSLMGEPLYRQNRSQTARNAAPSRMVKDPVCGMYMDSRLAVEVQNKGGYFYFCSDECRNKFLAHPR
jgi:uncharacterized protein